MTLRTRWLVLPVAALSVAGCRSTCCKKVTPLPPAAYGAPPPVAYPPPPPPRPAAELLPPAAPPPAPAAPAPVPPLVPPASNFAAPPPPAVSVTPAQPDAPAKLLEPEFGEAATPEPPVAKPAPADSPVKPAPPASSESKSSPATTLPVGIADFASAVDDRVTAGRKPALEGLDWLRANGYKAALLLRRPNEPDDADRKQFGDRGIKFASLDVSAAGLTKAKSDEFNRIVGDAAGHPLFVYDADGSLAGPLWYLYFRRVEKLDDEPARVRAGRLGLKTDATSGERAALWQAVQRLLN